MLMIEREVPPLERIIRAVRTANSFESRFPRLATFARNLRNYGVQYILDVLTPSRLLDLPLRKLICENDSSFPSPFNLGKHEWTQLREK